MSKRGSKDNLQNKGGRVTKNKKGQITIFIILAIAIVAGIVIFFVVRGNIFTPGINPQLQPVYSYFSSCIEEETKEAAKLAGTQAGYIYLPNFEPGSDFSPFSSQLNFLGFPVPYWQYLSGNGIIKEQTPTIKQIESQFNEYLESRLYECDLSDFRRKGFTIELKKPVVNVKIENEKISVNVNARLDVSLNNISATKSSHTASVDSKLGKFYNLAKEIYSQEKTSSFLENYGVDVLRLYAPVDGVEITCQPKIWNPAEISSTLQKALEANIQSIKLKGDYYSIKQEKKYFVQDISVDESINFLYSKSWPSRIEIWPVENSLMLAEPVGNQEGLGILGFCYVPYHFVYDIYFPVLIQIYDFEEIFQFPLSVIIEKNTPRQSSQQEEIEQFREQVCNVKNTDLNVYTYNQKLEPVEARIKFSCLDETCSLGETKLQGGDAKLLVKAPQCINAFVIADAEGYAASRQIISTNNPGEANIILNKIIELELDVRLNNAKSNDLAIINFVSDKNSYVASYPQQNKIKISEGLYNITVHMYKNSSIVLPESTTHKCVEVPQTGILSIFSSSKEQCFELTTPSQTITGGLIGGGKTVYYLSEAQMEKSSKLIVNSESLPVPQNLDEISNNYELFETKYVDVSIE